MTCQQCGTPFPEGAVGCLACAAVATDPGRTLAGRPTDQPPLDDLLTRVRRELASEYEVHTELGRGGMAVVYKATELELLRPVALKVLPPELSASATMSERFRREARLAASFDHPNIIPIYRVGQAGGVFYIAMKFIEGRPLDDIIERQGPLPVAVVVHVLRAAVRALAFAHRHGVIHRDVKGANILIDQDGRVVVSDFGIARAGEDAGMTATGALMGTPYFMSPEQCAGHRVAQQSDQYSLGVVAFQMLTGSVPFRAETIPGVMQHHFFTPVPDIRAVRSDIPEALVAVVQRALSKRAGDRYATTAEMQEAVDAIPFDESTRRVGDTMLRDLVLGVAVPRIDTGALPPLQETMLMTPPMALRAQRERGARRQTRWSLAAAGVGAVVIAASAYLLGTRPVASGATVRPAAPIESTRLAAPAIDSVTPRLAGEPRDDPPADAGQANGGAGSAVDAIRNPGLPSRAATDAAPEARPAPRSPAPSGKLRVRVQPSDAEISVDGHPLGRGIVLDSLVTPGPRRLRASAPGYQPLDTVITVRSGETSQIGTVRLRPVEDRQ